MRFLNKILIVTAILLVTVSVNVANAAVVDVGLNRAEIVNLRSPMSEVIIANPEIADIVVHGSKSVSIIGKEIGSTNIRFFDDNEKVIKEFDIIVGYDLPAIRRALQKFFPQQQLAVKTINNSLAISGVVPDAMTANRVMQVAYEFVKESADGAGGDLGSTDDRFPGIVNLLSLNSGQQVMLKVRIGELERTALKQLGFNLNGGNASAGSNFSFGTFAGASAQLQPQNFTDDGTLIEDAVAFLVSDARSGGGLFSFGIERGGLSASALLDALESDGLFKSVAEPTLTAISGETASFLAGGEFAVPTTNADGGTNVEFKEFGVSLAFTPFVLTQNRIRLTVAPELSELDQENAVGGIPALRTRKATTTVELAPGEGFMIAGLIRDRINALVDEIPGAGEVPILGSLLRSTSYQREETEMVISVTPYIVDPIRGIDVRLPSDEYRSPSVMEMFFYGALGSLNGDNGKIGQTPVLEGPIGYMVE